MPPGDDKGPDSRAAPPNPDASAPLIESTLRRLGLDAWRWIGLILLASIIYLGLAALAEFVVPLVVAIVLGMIFVPLVDLGARLMPRAIAAIVVLLGLVAASIATIGLVMVGVVQEGPRIAAELLSALDQLGLWLAERGIDIGPTGDIPDRLGGAVSEASPALLEYAPSAFSSVTGIVGGIFVGLFILYFVLLDWARMTDWVGAHIGVPADLGAGIVADATRSFREYFYVLTASSLPVAAMVGIAAVLMSVPLAFTIALVSLVTSYIPFVGAFIASVFALFIAFGSGGVVPALVMLVVIVVAQGVVQPIIQTRMQRDTLDIYPVVGFGATVAGAVLAGILGATLSAPVLAMVLRVRTRIRQYEQGAVPLRADVAVSGADPGPPPAAVE